MDLVTRVKKGSMQINFAGMNIDSHIFEELRTLSELEDIPPEELKELLTKATPEIISAASARISRNPKPIDKLRCDASKYVEQARKSAWTIIFGLGHSSVAEHAFFNLDNIGVSRLVVEELEARRLCSYTEKSQRYITFDNEFYFPSELKRTSLGEEYISLMQKLFAFYKKTSFAIETKLISEGKNPKEAIIMAKEDARYVLPLATLTQLELSGNARNLQYHITRLRASIPEAQDIGDAYYKILNSLAPSLFKYSEASKLYLDGEYKLQELIDYNLVDNKLSDNIITDKEFSKDSILHHGLKTDNTIFAALIVARSNLDFRSAYDLVSQMDDQEKMKIHLTAMKQGNHFNLPRREYEFENKVHEVIMSATAYAQFKRHRLCTQITQPYTAELGHTIPQSIIDVGLQKEFDSIVDESTRLFKKLEREGLCDIAPYTLTNAHNRRVLVNTNVRSLHKFAFERLDPHAQWDIRDIVYGIIQREKEFAPITLSLGVGKTELDNTYKKLEAEYVYSN